MKLQWIGHSSFFITADNGARIITDPYEYKCYDGAVGYAKIEQTTDIVTASHSHPDHFCTDSLCGSPQVINQPGEYSVNNCHIKGILTYHDHSSGKERGENVIFVMQLGGITIAHLGDLGHSLNNTHKEAIGKVDVILVPVGGYFTINAEEAWQVANLLSPKIVVPMHYKTPVLNFPIAQLDEFLNEKQELTRHTGKNIVDITDSTLPDKMEIWVLNYS